MPNITSNSDKFYIYENNKYIHTNFRNLDKGDGFKVNRNYHMKTKRNRNKFRKF